MANLQDAAPAAGNGARRVVIDPITRIEGHLRIEIAMGDDGTVADAFSSSTMFRGIETIMKGRDPRDLGLFAQRICGVCTFHHYERGVMAVEHAYGVQIPPNARLVRNLMWLAQILQDHCTHFYQLHAMDWFDVVSALGADPQRAADVAREYHPTPYNASAAGYARTAQRVAALVESGQLGPFAAGYWGHPKYRLTPEENLIMASHYLDNLLIQRTASKAVALFGSKSPHPQNLMVGGVSSVRDAMDAHTLGEYRSLIGKVADFVERAYLPDLRMIARRYRDDAVAGFGGGVRNYMSFGAIPLADARSDRTQYVFPPGIVLDRDLSTAHAIEPQLIREEVTHAWYTYDGNQDALNPLEGQTNPEYTGFNDDGTLQADGKYSWIKTPRYDGMPMEVGPLARFLIARAAGSERITELMDGFASDTNLPFEGWYSTVGRTVARGLEASLAAEVAQQLIGELATGVSQGDDRFYTSHQPRDGEGFALREAPRGALSHWIRIRNGVLENFQAVVPSTWNASPRDAQGQLGPYEAALVGQPVDDPTQPIEVLRTVHSFDPCLACAVHLVDARGEEIARFKVRV